MKRIALVLFFTILLNFSISLVKTNLTGRVFAQNSSPGLQTVLDKMPGSSSAYVFKDDGSVAERNGSSALPAFSVIKLWIAAATLNLVEGRTINLGEKIAGMTLDQHLNSMLIESSNESANALIDKIGFDNINAYIQANGYKQTVLNRKMLEDPKTRGDNLTSARDAATFMFNLVNKQVVSEAYSDMLISILQARTAAKKDFMPEPLSLSKAGFFGKSGTQADAGPIRNDAGTFVDSSGQRVFLAVLVPDAADSGIAIQVIQSVESAAFSGGPAGTGVQTGTSAIQNTGIASCKFYRPDQKPDSGYCPPDTEGTDRCASGLTFKSPLLINYIEEASRITGVPASLLAGIVRMESTVPLVNSVTGKSYSISDYTDDDIRAMEEFSKTVNDSNIDDTIGSTNKALCPRSKTDALGITQIEPLGKPGNSVEFVNKGAEFLAKVTGVKKDNNTLTYSDFCNPRYSVILAGGFILGKLGETSWQQPATQDAYKEKVLKIARLYYGEDSQLEIYRQGLWQGVNECKGGATTSPGSVSGSIKSNKLCVKVGDPTDPKPASCSTTAGTSAGGGKVGPNEPRIGGVDGINISCPLDQGGGFRLICGTSTNVRNGCGHGNPNAYQACIPGVYVCPYGPQIKAAVDVRPSEGNGANAPVFLPYINGNQSVTWTKVAGPIAIAGGTWGYRYEFETTYNSKKIRIDMTHLNEQITNAVNSGEQLGSLYPKTDGDGGHLHTSASIDGQWVDSISESFYCSK